MKKQIQDLTDTACYKTEKRGKKMSIHMHDTLKTKCEEKTQEKKEEKIKRKNSCELSSNCITSQRPVSSRFSFLCRV